MRFEAGPDKTEVIPGSIGGKTARENPSAMIIGGKDEALKRVGRPPPVRGRIVLEEFTDGSAFPASRWFRAWSCLADQQWIMLLNVLGDGGTGTDEIKAPTELIGDEGTVEWLGQGQYLLKKLFHRLRPEFSVIAAGGFWPEGRAIFEPSGTETIELCPTELEPFGGRDAIHSTAVEQSQYCLDNLRTGTVG